MLMLTGPMLGLVLMPWLSSSPEKVCLVSLYHLQLCPECSPVSAKFSSSSLRKILFLKTLFLPLQSAVDSGFVVKPVEGQELLLDVVHLVDLAPWPHTKNVRGTSPPRSGAAASSCCTSGAWPLRLPMLTENPCIAMLPVLMI